MTTKTLRVVNNTDFTTKGSPLLSVEHDNTLVALNEDIKLKLPLVGGELSGKLKLASSVAAYASFNITSGVTPTAPLLGDIWSTTNGLFYKSSATTLTFAMFNGFGTNGQILSSNGTSVPTWIDTPISSIVVVGSNVGSGAIYPVFAGGTGNQNIAIDGTASPIAYTPSTGVFSVPGAIRSSAAIAKLFDSSSSIQIGTTGSTINIVGTIQNNGANLDYSVPMTIVNATTVAAANNNHYILKNVAASNVDLPANPNVGDIVIVTPINGLTTNTINNNTKKIMSSATVMTIDRLNYTVRLRYINSTVGWFII
jgi:hypothetical protein